MDRTSFVRLRVLGVLCVAAQAALPLQAQTADDRGATNTIVDMGGTYYTLEAKARKVTMRLPGKVATVERLIDGDLRTTLHDVPGNELARLRVHRKALLATDLDYNGIRMETTLPFQPTLDWAGLQTVALEKDKPAKHQDLEWQERFIRTHGRHAEVLDDLPNEIAVEFEGGLSAVTTRAVGHPEVKTKRPLFVTRVFRDGVQVGSTWWIPSTKTFGWKFPGLTEGYLDEARQKRSWTFKPTMAWANVQGLAFYEFHSRMAADGQVASNCPSAPKGPLARLTDLIMPTVYAQDGCTYMHYLDSTILRPCCDRHDRCYVQYSCTIASWYRPWGQNWRCGVQCNVNAFNCFLTLGQDCISGFTRSRECGQFVWGN